MRTYGDGCTSAHALDLVGERWALLIVRDLLFGPKRFGDLHAGLPQASPNVLTQRLRELEDAGVVRRRRLPAPASATVYELTPWGAELEPIVLGLQRWGAGSPSMPEGVPVGCDAAMLALKNAFRAEAAAGLHLTIEVRFATATFGLAIDDGTIGIARGSATEPDAVLETDPDTLEHLALFGRSLRAAERAGSATVTGDRDAVEHVLAVFAAPPPS
jgi:DNA-binding HxlR family transcriptional regulator